MGCSNDKDRQEIEGLRNMIKNNKIRSEENLEKISELKDKIEALNSLHKKAIKSLTKANDRLESLELIQKKNEHIQKVSAGSPIANRY